MALRKSSLLVGTVLSGLALAPAPAPAQASPSPWTSGARYDAMGRATGTIAPDPDGAGPLAYAAVRNSYDAAGRLIKVEQGELAAWQSEAVAPAAWTGFTVHRVQATVYDNMGRKTRDVLSAPDGTVRAVTQHGYDALGRLECTAVRMNPALWPNAAGAGGALPASACTPGTQGTGANDFGPDRIVRNLYDAAGQRLQLRVGVGTAVEGAQASWAYNLNGQVTTMIDGNGNRATLSYDGHGRQDRWTFPSTTRPTGFDDSTPAQALATAGAVNAADHEDYGYDANSNRTSLRKRDGSELTFQYDALNRMTVKVVPERPGLAVMHTRDVHYAYDLRGLMTHARFDSLSGEGVTTQYDGFGRIASSSLAMGGYTRTISHLYDRNGNRTLMTLPGSSFWSYQYDGLNRVTSITENATTQVIALAYSPQQTLASRVNPATGAASGSSLAYDDVGRLSLLSHNFGGITHDVSWTYAYNPASQVRQVTRDNDSYAWTNHYGVARSYTTNGLNQYTQVAGTPHQYDANGNLTSDGSRTYTYDVENRLVGVSGGITLTYDPLGRLWQVTGGAAGTTRFLYDGDALVAEFNAGSNMLRRFVHGPGADVPLIWLEGGVKHYLHADRQGSIVHVAASNGHPFATNAYDEYGVPRAGNVGRFQYTGQIWLAELGMYHYKARVYSPTLGRFLQTDPVGYDDQMNLYAYVGNDPVNFSDPTGTSRIDELAENRRARALSEIRNILTEYTSQGRAVEDPESSPTDDERSAAAQFARLWSPILQELGASEEFVATIVTRASDDLYSFTVPFLVDLQETREGRYRSFEFNFRLTAGLQAQADIHTHSGTNGYSAGDMANIERTRRGSYLVDRSSTGGTLWYMRPGRRGNRGGYQGAVQICRDVTRCRY